MLIFFNVPCTTYDERPIQGAEGLWWVWASILLMLQAAISPEP